MFKQLLIIKEKFKWTQEEKVSKT